MKMLVLRSKDILLSYTKMIGRLTKIDFALREKDPWIERSGCNFHLDDFVKRIDTVYGIMATHDEVQYVLSSSKKIQDFKSLNLLEVRNVFLHSFLISFHHTIPSYHFS